MSLAGLDIDNDTILQAAMIVTDGQLKHQVQVSICRYHTWLDGL